MKNKGKAPVRNPRGETDSAQSVLMNVPNHYLAMMKDIQDEAKKIDDSRPLKRRRIKRESTLTKDSEIISISSGDSVIEISDEDESDDDDEMEWDDVSLLNTSERESFEESVSSTPIENESAPITISLSNSSSRATAKSKPQRSSITKEEKANRLLIHKLQLLCLLHHVSMRNKWCNDFLLRKGYSKVLSNNILSELFPPDHLSPTLKTRKFLDGLRHASKAWSDHFRITHKGLRMIGWNEIFDKSRLIEGKMGLEKFRHHLLKFRGSNDLSAQGFCALLRSIDIDARLVCSLQPLDWTSTAVTTPLSVEEPRDERRLSTPPLSSEYPIYWVEAYDNNSQRWVTIDPTVTNSVDIVRTKSKLEPPQSDSCNNLRYVIAFDVNGRARDVTRRYAVHYNSKTRKKRITCTESGRIWWEKVMQIFSPKQLEPRDIAELSELNKRELNEGLPTSIQDFKGHPVYVLEQHLHQNEVLDPKISCGTLALKHTRKLQKGSVEEYINGRTCSIYRRKDVKVVRSAQAWYRLGRVIKSGSQPLKHGKARRLNDVEEEEANIGLYSLDQTVQYVPPVVENGIVPKNGFGNVDVYVPSMIPKGGCHLRYPNISLAARILGVDYADAVCGFDFNRRKMTPRVEGIVVANEFEEGVMAVYNQLIEEKEEEDRRMIELKALLRWKRYLVALQIRSRLDRVHGKVDVSEEDVSEDDSEVEEVIGSKPKGRFDLSDIVVPNVRVRVRVESREGVDRPEDVLEDVPKLPNDVADTIPKPLANTSLANTPLANTPLPDTSLADTPLPNISLTDTPLPDTTLPNTLTPLPNTPLPHSPLPDSPLPDSPQSTSDTQGDFLADSMSESELLAEFDDYNE